MKDMEKDILKVISEKEDITLIEIAEKLININKRKDWEKLIKTLDWLESNSKIEERSYPDGKIAYSLE